MVHLPHARNQAAFLTRFVESYGCCRTGNAELGFLSCYGKSSIPGVVLNGAKQSIGDFSEQHSVQLPDMQMIVDTFRIRRPVLLVHLHGPRDREGAEYLVLV